MGCWPAPRCRGPPSIVNGTGARQPVVPDHLQSRVDTTARVIGRGGATIGAVVGGATAAATDVRTAHLLAVAGVATSAVLAPAAPQRLQRRRAACSGGQPRGPGVGYCRRAGSTPVIAAP